MGVLTSIEQKHDIELFVFDNTFFFFVSRQNINCVTIDKKIAVFLFIIQHLYNLLLVAILPLIFRLFSPLNSQLSEISFYLVPVPTDMEEFREQVHMQALKHIIKTQYIHNIFMLFINLKAICLLLY